MSSPVYQCPNGLYLSLLSHKAAFSCDLSFFFCITCTLQISPLSEQIDLFFIIDKANYYSRYRRSLLLTPQCQCVTGFSISFFTNNVLVLRFLMNFTPSSLKMISNTLHQNISLKKIIKNTAHRAEKTLNPNKIYIKMLLSCWIKLKWLLKKVYEYFLYANNCCQCQILED